MVLGGVGVGWWWCVVVVVVVVFGFGGVEWWWWPTCLSQLTVPAKSPNSGGSKLPVSNSRHAMHKWPHHHNNSL